MICLQIHGTNTKSKCKVGTEKGPNAQEAASYDPILDTNPICLLSTFLATLKLGHIFEKLYPAYGWVEPQNVV